MNILKKIPEILYMPIGMAIVLPIIVNILKYFLEESTRSIAISIATIVCFVVPLIWATRK